MIVLNYPRVHLDVGDGWDGGDLPELLAQCILGVEVEVEVEFEVDCQ